MYYRGSAAAVVVYDITSEVSVVYVCSVHVRMCGVHVCVYVCMCRCVECVYYGA